MSGGLFHDAGTAWRGLLKNPFYLTATIVMLALAIGANMTAFGFLYGYDIKALPYQDASRIVMVRESEPRIGLNDAVASPQVWRAVQALPSVEAAGLWSYLGPAVARIEGHPREVRATQVTPSFLTTLGARPVIGRLPSNLSGVAGGPAEAMISWQFWQAAYAGRDAALGQRISVFGVDYAIVGVLPKAFGFNDASDLWAAFAPPLTGDMAENINDFLPVRLAPGVSLQEFDLQLKAVLQGVEQDAPPKDAADMRNRGARLDALPIRGVLLSSGEIGGLPYVLQGVALFLLLLAIANAGNLALVRNGMRQPDFALRQMLGASRGRLLKMFLLEHLPIFLAAGLGGSLIGGVVLGVLLGFPDIFEAPPLDIASGWPVYGFAWALAAVATLLIILAPAWQISAQALGGGLGLGRKSTLSAGMRRAQDALGAVQIGLAAALLIGSATMSLSLVRLLTQPLGFEATRRVVAEVLLPQNVAPPQFKTAIDAVAALPVTVSAGGALEWAYPYTQSLMRVGISRGTGTQSVTAFMAPVYPGYFKTLGLHIEAGQGFDAAAFSDGATEIIISPDLARQIFGAGSAIGNMIDVAGLHYRVIGIAAPVLWQPTTDDGSYGLFYVTATSLMKLPLAIPFSGETLIANVGGPLAEAMPLLKTTIENAIPGSVVATMRPYGEVISALTAFRAVVAGLVAGFAVLAMVLAGLGIYAVNALIARARLPEFGMRAMLGASPGNLLRLAMTDAAWLLAFGLGGGGLGGYFLVRAMSPLLFHVAGSVPWVFAGSLVVIAVIVLGAAWRPAALAAHMPVKRLLDAA